MDSGVEGGSFGISIDPLEMSLLLGLFFTCFGHAGIPVKASNLRRFLDYEKSSYDVRISRAFVSLAGKGLVGLHRRSSKAGKSGVMSVELTEMGARVVRRALGLSLSESAGSAGLKAFLEWFCRRIMDPMPAELRGIDELHRWRRIDAGFLLLLGGIHLPGLFILEDGGRARCQEIGSPEEIRESLVSYVRLYLNPDSGPSIDEQWYPSRMVGFGVARMYRLDEFRREALRRYCRQRLGRVREASASVREEVMSQFHIDGYLEEVFEEGNKELVLRQALRLIETSPFISWSSGGSGLENEIRKTLGWIGSATEYLRTAALAMVFVMLCAIFLMLPAILTRRIYISPEM